MTVTAEATPRGGRDGAVLGAFLCGLATGAALALLFAPARGRDTRERLLAKAAEGRDRLARHAQLRRLTGELEAWTTTIEALKARVARTAGDVRLEYEKRLADLQSRLEAARRTLDRLRTSGAAAGHELLSGADRAWEELRAAVERAASELRAEPRGGRDADA